MTSQEKIDIEIVAMRILQQLLQHQEGVIWTAGILEDALRIQSGQIKNGLKWLLDRDYITSQSLTYSRTEAGRQYFEYAQSRPEMPTDMHAWKVEVLTGVCQKTTVRKTGDWQRSNIINGVLPKGRPELSPNVTPEDVLFEKEEKQQIKKMEQKTAKMLGLKIAEFRRLFEAGLIKWCRGIGNGEHVGVFHKKGNGTQYLCVECRKAVRTKG